ncbi:MAG: CPBP family intramembrane metalloprotease [Planctomycetes bacterium]|nr:CPBP family intramembrane metalloprotease [Planctomycetota bacterium]
MAGASRGKLAGIAAAYAVGVGLLLWANRRLEISTLLLLPPGLALSWLAARWAWGREWPSHVGLAWPREWIAVLLLGLPLAASLVLIAGPPSPGRLDRDAWLDAFVTATSEETIWRGILLGLLLGALPRPVAILLSSVVFGGIHFLHVLEGAPASHVALRAAAVTGLAFVLCGLRLRSGLVVAILAHAMWNLWAAAGGAINRIAFASGPAGVLWAAAAMILFAAPFLFRRMPRPRWILCFAAAAMAAAWTAWSEIQPVRRQRAALERCADWGIVDVVDFMKRPDKTVVNAGNITVTINRVKGLWNWAPSAREEPLPEPTGDLELLQTREAIPYLRHVATTDPDGRMRVAANGLLRRMVDECVPRWIVEGQHVVACWSLLDAYREPHTGGAWTGPDSHGLNALLRAVVGHDPETGRAMVAALIEAMDRADMFGSLCLANAIRQSHLDLTGFRERLLSCLREGSDAGAAGSASILAYMGEVENRAIVEKTLDRWAADQPQAERALRHLRKLPASPPRMTVAATRDWDVLRSRLAEVEAGWVFERTSTVALRPFETPVIARSLFWRAGADRVSATATEFERPDEAERMFAREACPTGVARESKVEEAAGETATFASRDMVMILARRGTVYYQVNGRRAEAQRLHEHIERFLGAGKDATK